MQQRGFTLIEILVVLVIIAMLVSMAAVNTGSDPRIKQLSKEAQRLRFVLEDLSERAVFKNTDLGFVANKTEITFYEYILLTPKDENDPSSVDIFSWQLSKQASKNPFELSEESMSLTLLVEGLPIQLSFAGTQDKKEIEPQFFAYSSGEQDVIKFEISIDDIEYATSVSGMGVGRFYTGDNHEE